MKSRLFDSTVIREAREATDFMANVLEASTEYSIIGKDLEGRILLWNEGARRMYGYEPEEVVGKANSDILHTPEDLALAGGVRSWTLRCGRANGKASSAGSARTASASQLEWLLPRSVTTDAVAIRPERSRR